MKNIASALLKAQSEMSNPVKGSNNPFFKNINTQEIKHL